MDFPRDTDHAACDAATHNPKDSKAPRLTEGTRALRLSREQSKESKAPRLKEGTRALGHSRRELESRPQASFSSEPSAVQ